MSKIIRKEITNDTVWMMWTEADGFLQPAMKSVSDCAEYWAKTHFFCKHQVKAIYVYNSIQHVRANKEVCL